MAYLSTYRPLPFCIVEAVSSDEIGDGTEYPFGLTFDQLMTLFYRMQIQIAYNTQCSGYVNDNNPSWFYFENTSGILNLTSNMFSYRLKNPFEDDETVIKPSSEAELICKKTAIDEPWTSGFIFLNGASDDDQLILSENFSESAPVTSNCGNISLYSYTQDDDTFEYRYTSTSAMLSVNIWLNSPDFSIYPVKLYSGLYYPYFLIAINYDLNALLSGGTKKTGAANEIVIGQANLNLFGGQSVNLYGPDLGVSISSCFVNISSYYWPYDPGDTAAYPGKDGSGPVYDITTGSQLRDPFKIVLTPSGFYNPYA